MKRPWLLLICGWLAAAVAGFAAYYAGTACCRNLEASQTPELAWLKAEFHLGDTEFARISKLHESYLAACAERCRKVDEKNMELRELLARTNAVTPEIAKVLGEAAQLRADCQKEMLQHFFEVSQTMPPEEGRRYLAWVQARTLSANTHTGMHH
jgi:hypothetical protein